MTTDHTEQSEDEMKIKLVLECGEFELVVNEILKTDPENEFNENITKLFHSFPQQIIKAVNSYATTGDVGHYVKNMAKKDKHDFSREQLDQATREGKSLVPLICNSCFIEYQDFVKQPIRTGLNDMKCKKCNKTTLKRNRALLVLDKDGVSRPKIMNHLTEVPKITVGS